MDLQNIDTINQLKIEHFKLFIEHISSYSNLEEFKCYFCEESFIKNDRDTHLEKHLPRKVAEKPDFQKPKVDPKIDPNIEIMVEKSVICFSSIDEIKNSFANKSQRKSGFVECKQEISFTCDFCKKQFNEIEEFDQHTQSHVESSDSDLEIIGTKNGGSKNPNVQFDEKIDKGIKRKLMFCAICEKEGFENIPDLKNHVRNSHKPHLIKIT